MGSNENSRLDDILKLLSDRDILRLLGYLLIMVLLAYALMDIFSRSWGTGIMGQSKDTIRGISPSGISFLTNIFFGFFIGSIWLMSKDRRKRIQALILAVGLGVIIIYMVYNFQVNWNILFLIIGLSLGYITGGGSGNDSDKNRQAVINICIVSILYIVISYLNIYLLQDQFTELFFIDSAVVMAFSYVFGTIMSYKGKSVKIFVLGPGRSGKTVFMVGCYKTVLDSTDRPTRPSPNLLDAYKRLHRQKSDNISDASKIRESDYWVGETEKTTEYEFKCEGGSLIPKEIVFKATDYSGAYLENIPNALYKIRTEDTDVLLKKYIEVADEIITSDKLIFILDGRNHPMYEEISHYIDIINRLYRKGKNFQPYIVMTKSDKLVVDFGKEPGKDDYLLFKEYISRILANNEYVKMLFTETSIRSIYPVFYYTEKDVNGFLKPMRDKKTGRLFVFGFEEFMEDLLER